MIEVTMFNGNTFYLNSNEIERIDLIPETAIVLLNGKSYIVKETAKEVIGRIVKFNQKINCYKNIENV